jgi:hypothetical protein
VYDDLDVDGINTGFVEEVKEKEAQYPGDHGSLLVLTIREILWNYSDSSHTFSVKISQTDLFHKLAHDLDIIREDDLADMAVLVSLISFRFFYLNTFQMNTYTICRLFKFNSKNEVYERCPTLPRCLHSDSDFRLKFLYLARLFTLASRCWRNTFDKVFHAHSYLINH